MSDVTTDLLARLQRLEDLQELTQLCHDYGRYLDAGELWSWAGLFARDGELRLGPMGAARGQAELVKMMTEVQAQTPASYHVLGIPTLQIDGDVATGENLWVVVDDSGETGSRVSRMGRHRDEFVREDGAWRIKVRRGLQDLPRP